MAVRRVPDLGVPDVGMAASRPDADETGESHKDKRSCNR